MSSARGIALLLSLALATPLAQAACEATAAYAADADDWFGWGRDEANARHVRAEGGALTEADLAQLELRWAFGFEGVRSVIGQPSVTGGRVLIGVDTGMVHALDAATGEECWSFQAGAGVRTAPVVADVDGEALVFVGDMEATVYALGFADGTPRWHTRVEDHPAARLTGSPQYLRTADGGRLYMPVSSSEEGAAGNPDYPCCTFRGSVVALDARDGAIVWKTYTIVDAPRETGPNRYGPSGAAVWSPPTLDPARGQLYVATGDAYSAPADVATDAVIAMALDDGAIRWVAQDTADDIWTVACMRPGAPEECGPDHDFGAPPILVNVDGREMLIAGQKSGNVWAHDPDSGAVLWRTPMVEDTTAFGGKIIWGGATDGVHAWFGLGSGGIGAVALDGSGMPWFTPLTPAPEVARHGGHDGPLTLSGDLLLSGGWDGVLRVLAPRDGRVLWQYDTVRDFATVNGVAARGGSIGAAGPVVSHRRLFLPSGYIGVKNGMSGNVLLMFEAAR